MRFVSNLTDDAPNPSIGETHKIYDPVSYCGSVTLWRGIGWTHSLLRFGADPFPTQELAEIDFWATKAELSAPVHKAIFGSITS